MWILLLLAALGTSFLSGVFGMAGGLLLMGVFGSFFSVPIAMMLHGYTQLVSNGSRAWLLRKSIRWGVTFPYLMGLLVTLAVYSLVFFNPEKSLFFLLLGALPLIGLVLPQSWTPDIAKPRNSFLCGLLITAINIPVGVAGPILDLFFVKSSLTRHEIVGTKAVTQTLAHFAKIFYYGSLSWRLGSLSSIELEYWTVGLPIAAICGTRMGKLVLDRMHDDFFRRIAKWLIGIIGLGFLSKGLLMLWSDLSLVEFFK